MRSRKAVDADELCVGSAGLLHTVAPALVSATDESQGAGQKISGGLIDRVAGPAGLRSPPVSSVRRTGTMSAAFFARICAGVSVTGVAGGALSG